MAEPNDEVRSGCSQVDAGIAHTTKRDEATDG
jgi:hypothetical protein